MKAGTLRLNRALILVSFLGLISMPVAAEETEKLLEEHVQDHKEHVNTGQDPTKPLTRMDIRYQWTNPANTGNDINTLILRADAPILMNKGKWGALYTRMDAPFTAITDNEGDGDSGFGSLYTQALHIVPKSWGRPLGIDAWAYGGAIQWGTSTSTTQGQTFNSYVGLIAAKWDLNKDGSNFTAAILKWYVGSANNDLDDVGELHIQPLTNFHVPKFIDFITLWGNYDIILNKRDGAVKESGDWFVPYDITFGKMVSPKVVLSLSFAGPIHDSDTYELYDDQMLLRFGFFF